MPVPISILVIEDDHDIRVSFRQTLESCGFEVHSAANGKDGLELLQQMLPPQLIILDLAMPIMNGEEFLRQKNKTPQWAEIPVLLVSCHQEKLIKMQQHPQLRKPVDLNNFTRTVSQCLRTRVS